MSQFIRSVTVVISIAKSDFSGYDEIITIKGLRVSFSVQKNLAWSTNTATVKIWNLSTDHRNAIKDYGDQIKIYAGYERSGNEELLFIGDTTAVSHIFDQPDIVTILEVADGDKYFNQKHDSLSFESGVTVNTIIENIALRMGIETYPIPTNEIVYPLGFSFSGMLKDALVKVCDYANLQSSIQNNTLLIIPKDGSVNEP